MWGTILIMIGNDDGWDFILLPRAEPAGTYNSKIFHADFRRRFPLTTPTPCRGRRHQKRRPPHEQLSYYGAAIATPPQLQPLSASLLWQQVVSPPPCGVGGQQCPPPV